MEHLRAAIKEAQKYAPCSHDESAHQAIDQVCAACGEELDDVCQEILNSDHEVPGDTTIIHYTGIDVLTCIFNRLADKKNQQVSLRTYDTIHLNDPQEGDFLTSLTEEKHDWLHDHSKNGQTSHAYIASFILQKEEMQDNTEETQDDLVFWRAYGKGGKGCSLLIPTKNPPPKLYKVLYGENPAKKAIEKIYPKIQDIESEWHTLKNSLEPRHRKYLEGKFKEVIWRTLDKIRFLYKSTAYQYENECRFVLTDKEYNQDSGDKAIFEYKDWGDGAPRIRHYLEPGALDIKKLLISESIITLGPLVPHRENVEYCLEEMKRKCKIYGPKVEFSKILYQEA